MLRSHWCQVASASRQCRSREFLQLGRSICGFNFSLGNCPERHTNQNVQRVLLLYHICLCLHGRLGVCREESRDSGTRAGVCQSLGSYETWGHSIIGVIISLLYVLKGCVVHIPCSASSIPGIHIYFSLNFLVSLEETLCPTHWLHGILAMLNLPLTPDLGTNIWPFEGGRGVS